MSRVHWPQHPMKVRQDKIVRIFLGIGGVGSGEPGLAGSKATAPGLPVTHTICNRHGRFRIASETFRYIIVIWLTRALNKKSLSQNGERELQRKSIKSLVEQKQPVERNEITFENRMNT